LEILQQLELASRRAVAWYSGAECAFTGLNKRAMDGQNAKAKMDDNAIKLMMTGQPGFVGWNSLPGDDPGWYRVRQIF